MSYCQKCQQKQNRYKILQADLQFQIKKMKEDLANEKVTLELHYQKEYKKVIEKYNKEKMEREQENKKWIQKYDQTVQQNQTRVAQLTKEYQKRQKEFEEQLKKEYKKSNQELIKNYNYKESQRQRLHRHQISKIQSKFLLDSQRAKKQKQEEILKLTKGHQKEVNEMARDYDFKIQKLKEQVSNTLQSIDKLKLQTQQKQTLLYQELYHRKQEINDLKYNVDQLQNNIQMIEEEIRLKNIEIQVLKEKHEQNIKELHRLFKNEKEEIVSQFSLQIENILKDKLDDCQKYEQVVKEIEGKRQNEIKLYESNLKEVKQFVEQRPSRDEDIEQITILKELLNQKQRECQKAFNDAKGYRLQLNNKQEVFNKIFCSHNSPLNIEKLGKRKDTKIARASSSTMKDISKYQNINTFHAPTTADLVKRQKLALQPKSTKYF